MSNHAFDRRRRKPHLRSSSKARTPLTIEEVKRITYYISNSDNLSIAGIAKIFNRPEPMIQELAKQVRRRD